MSRTPGMKVAPNSSIQELRIWQRMYENPFFNPGKRVTEKDVENALSYSLGQQSIVSGPRPSGVPKVPNTAKSRTLKKNQEHHTLATSHHFKNLPIPKRKAVEADEDHENRQPARPVSTARSRDLSATPESRPPSRQLTPAPSRPLARRPRLSVVNVPVAAALLGGGASTARAPEKPPSPPPPSPIKEDVKPPSLREKQSEQEEPEGTTLDSYIEYSFTTVIKHDDPTNPNSYYNTHYPLLLNKIPRRVKKEDSMCNLENLAVNRSEIDMSFYDQVPLRRLSTPTMSRLNTRDSEEFELPPQASSSSHT